MATSPAKGKNISAVARKLAENLNTDLRTLSTECRRKYPVVKEASESCMLKMRTITARAEDIIPGLVASNQEILQPLILGCDTKQPKIVHMCLIAVQRLIAHEAVSMPGANAVIQCLWMLMEAGIEELKLLQTAILLITTNSVVQHESLAKAMVLCFRLHFTKDNTTNNTAAATIRQLVTAVFERVVAEDDVPKQAPLPEMNVDELKAQGRHPPKSLQPCAGDAYLLFQDFCQLVNADQPHWLMGMTEMTRTFGLELVESVLTDFPSVFHKHPEFSFLLKERVCPLVIKLFSPSLKYKQGVPPPPSPTPAERPYFPIVMRLLKMVSVLIKHYYSILATECEIFLSLLVKFLDVEKPMWQRILALEVMNRLCTQPDLLKSFCSCYDMRQHSTNIFQDMVNSLGSFIQSQFLNPPTTQSSQGSRPPDTQGTPPALVGGLPVGGGITPQPAFLYRGIWLPLVVNISAPSGSHRAIFLEMLDKVEAPGIPDGYGISLAFLCLLDVVRGVQSLVEEKTMSTSQTDTETQPEKSDKSESSLNVQLINSSWCGVMAALSLLLESSTDESATEAILKAMQIFANLCGQLGMHTPRDAFITALCKASLPPHYALAVLNTHGPPPVIQRAHSSGRGGTGDSSGGGQEVINSSQVVAVGTPLPTASLPVGAQQASVMLTAKNIQCMRAILSVAHCHGGILGSAWHLVLTTLQHLVWILGLKPSTGGSLKAGQQATDGPNAVVTTAVMADLPVLSAMLSRLFESSQYLDDVALHHLINALCELSTEAMEIAYSNKEPSLFAVAKLLETGLVNLPRLEVLWKPVTGHLKEVCQHPHVGMRSWGAEALTSLIRGALSVKLDPPVHKNVRLQSMILAPLQELSGIMHPDIRQKQLECVLQILHSNGETLAQGWPLVLGVIGAVTNEQGESLIRVAFQSLQLVVTDFLPIMPCTCLQVCVEVASKFGLQDQELNISLTAIGLLWNVSDYFYQNRDRIIQDLGKDLSPKEQEKLGMPPFDALWMCLYMKLGDLCVDLRPAVRKSAGQTLFSTISAHGSLLQPQTWHTALWKVLFPLLEKVKELSNKASSTREEVQGGGGNILIHHSRDTAQKQWAETSVLTMAGVARVFNTKRKVLQALDDFPRAWALFLEYIEAAALCGVAEVSLAALKSFQEILQIKKDSKDEWVQLFGNRNPKELIPPVEEKIQRTDQQRELQTTQGTTEVAPPGDQSDTPVEDMALWSNAWKVWLSIGTKVTTPPDMAKPASAYIPSQPFLTALIQIFPALYEHIKSRFVAADLQKLSLVLQRALAVPVHTDSSPFIMPQDNNLTSLQEAILTAVKALHKEILNGAESSPTMYADLFDQLLTFVGYAVKPPRFGKVEAKVVGSAKMVQADWVAMNFVPFAESVVDLVVELYKATAKHPAVIKEYVLQHIIKTFRSPLSLKYGCPSQSTWILVINSLLVILNVGLPVARQNGSSFKGMWNELGAALEDFLFPHHTAPSTLSAEDYQRDEAIDCKVIHLIRDDILPYTKTVPQEFVVKIMSVLNKGSIHSATTTLFIDTDSSRKLREEFAKACFETLLQFSFLSKCPTEEGSITKLAVSSLLQRCKEVLIKYVEDERLSGKCPLPRARMAEMAFVMKAVTTLLTTLKKAPQANVEGNIWQQLVDLYPALVDCTTSSSPQVCRALKEALHQYGDLLTPPRPSSQNGV